MSAQSLGQVLLVEPSTPFSQIAQAIQSLGWTREEQSSSPSLKAGEPEFATWTRSGLKPFVIYTFNPVVSMRVLDVATVPPILRGALAKKLPLIDERAVNQLFESGQVKDRLLALWAAQETERVDLLNKVESLQQDAEPLIATEAKAISQRLTSMKTAHLNMLTQLKMLEVTAPQLIMQMGNPHFVASLKPSRDDLLKLADEYLVEALEACVESIYQQQPFVQGLEAHAEIEVFTSPAGLLRWPNMLSKRFPGGYRDIAGWLNPRLIWLAWKIKTPEAGTVSYDGLVWLEDKWLWLPKIFRYLSPYVMVEPGQSVQRH